MEYLFEKYSTMKIKFFQVVFILSFGITNSYAQSFGSSDSSWSFDIQSRYGICKVQFEKDTLISNLEFNKFTMNLSYLGSSVFDTIHESADPIFIADLSGLILFSLDGFAIDTLMNFNSELGDSWTLYDSRPGADDLYELTVVDTFRTEFNNYDLFSMSYSMKSNEGGMLMDTFYEQIGYATNFIIPYDGWSSVFHNNVGGTVRCFENKALGLIDFGIPWYQEDFEVIDYDCSMIASLSESVPDDQAMLFPNPASDMLVLDESLHHVDQLVITNNTGQLIEICARRKVIDVSEYETGTYIVGCYEKGLRVQSIRFIKI